MKRATIELISVNYGASNIGNDLQISFEIEGTTKVIDTSINHLKEQSFNTQIFQGLVDENHSIIVKAKVTEKDSWDGADDIGTATLHLKGSGDYSLIVNVNEAKQIRTWKGWSYTKKRVVSSTVATFHIKLKATLADPVTYVSDADGKGWLKVKLDTGIIVSLPYMLKVSLIKETESREHFEILEGSYLGKTASVTKREGGGSYLSASEVHKTGVTVVFNKTSQELTIGSKSYFAITDSSNPVPSGTWSIEIPDAPHQGGHYYESSSKYATTWFRVGHSGDRYLHSGNRSAGCVTVKKLSGWDEIYNKLIRSRKNKLSVGTLKVED